MTDFSNIVLFAIFLAVIAVLVSIGFFSGRLPVRYGHRDLKCFETAPRLMNFSEYGFYQAIKQRLPQGWLIAPLVRMEDVIRVKEHVKNKSRRQSLRGRVKSRHFDLTI